MANSNSTTPAVEPEAPAALLRRAAESLRQNPEHKHPWELATADAWEHIADDMSDYEAYEVPMARGPVAYAEGHGHRFDWTATLTAARAYLGEVSA